jgi:hypothetical protein
VSAARVYRWFRHCDWLVISSRKVYVRIPGGEIQWGRVSHTLTVWFPRTAARMSDSAANQPDKEEINGV